MKANVCHYVNEGGKGKVEVPLEVLHYGRELLNGHGGSGGCEAW